MLDIEQRQDGEAPSQGSDEEIALLARLVPDG